MDKGVQQPWFRGDSNTTVTGWRPVVVFTPKLQRRDELATDMVHIQQRSVLQSCHFTGVTLRTMTGATA